MRRTILLQTTGLLLGVSQLGSAQEIRAVTLDRETKQPVAGVLISLLDRRQQPIDTTRTASDGTFTVRSTEAGKFFLRAQRPGFPVEETDAIFLAAGQVRFDTLYIAAARAVQRVGEMVSREVFRLFGVSTTGLPTRAVILPEDMEKLRGSPQWASEVVLQLGPPQVRVSGSGIGRVCYQVYSGGCARVYLNGQQVQSSIDVPVDELQAIVVLSPIDVQSTLGRTNGAVLLFTNSMLRR